MENKKIKTSTVLLVMVLATSAGCNNKETNNDISQSEVDSLKRQIEHIAREHAAVAKNLAAFDTLDFQVFNKQDWSRFHESHAEDVTVHFPDGHATHGLKKHIEDMEAMFVYAPDTKITAHPIKLGKGNITAVTGTMEGTFTKPMPDGKGNFIQPTGKKFKIPMATFSIWRDDGTMSEEYLYWDNDAYMKQMGVNK